MSRLSIVIFSFMFFLISLLGCNRPINSGQRDSDNDTPTDTDTVTDTGDKIHDLFECPASVTEPANVVTYKHYYEGAEALEFYDTAWSIAQQWFDNNCVADCQKFPPDLDECLEADCETDAGATMVYTFTKKEESYGEIPVIETIEEHLTITTPEQGDSWDTIVFNRRIKRKVKKICMNGIAKDSGFSTYNHTKFDVSWTGEISKGLPHDYQVECELDIENGYDSHTSKSLVWNHEACNLLSSRWYAFEFGSDYFKVRVNNDEVQTYPVSHGEEAWLNGVEFGIVDSDTWQLLE